LADVIRRTPPPLVTPFYVLPYGGRLESLSSNLGGKASPARVAGLLGVPVGMMCVEVPGDYRRPASRGLEGKDFVQGGRVCRRAVRPDEVGRPAAYDGGPLELAVGAPPAKPPSGVHGYSGRPKGEWQVGIVCVEPSDDNLPFGRNEGI
jgi:hypothetical protein